MKSLMHEKDGTCYLCMKLEGNYFPQRGLHEHHVMFGNLGSGRKLSEKYGLKVYLCIRHHLADGGPDAVHRSRASRELLCKEAQRCFERNYPNLSFREIFGKNWLTDEDRIQETKQREDTGEGFILIPGIEEELNNGNEPW